MSRLLALVFAIFALVAPARAFAYTPPPLVGHVVDAARLLNEEQRAALDAKLDRFQAEHGYAIVVLTVPSLEGETIEDVAYDAFNAWGVGAAHRDDGVLLVIAPHERRTRIETGKGVGGALPDIVASDILDQHVNPMLARGEPARAVDDGVTAIAAALTSDTDASRRSPTADAPSPLSIGIGATALLLVVLLAIVSPGFRRALLFFLFMGFRGGGGGWGGGGGSSYSGGGGRSGGGGASGSY